MDGDTPVVDAPATPNAEIAGQQVETTATAVATPEAPAVEPSAAAPTRPDLATLLSDPDARRQLLSDAETRKLLFEDPDIRREIDHRASSEAGRRAKAEREAWQQQEAVRLERERIDAMDPYDLGVQEKERLAAIKEQEALQEKLRPMQSDIHSRLLFETGSEIFGAVQKVAKASGLNETDMEKVNPFAFNSLGEFTQASIEFIAERKAKELAKPLARAEAKAMFEEHLAARRETIAVPESLPAAGAGQGDEEFMADYAAGKNMDTARQIKWMKDHGIPL